MEQAGVERAQGFVVERGGRLVFDENVRGGDEPLERVVALGGVAVEDDALPAAMEVEEVQAYRRGRTA